HPIGRERRSQGGGARGVPVPAGVESPEDRPRRIHGKAASEEAYSGQGNAAGSGGGCPETGSWPCYGRLSHLCADLFQLLQDVQLRIPAGAAVEEEPYASI